MDQAEDMCRIGISGSYGGMNLGDEAILQCIVSGISSLVPARFTVFSRDASDTLARHKVHAAVPVRELTRGEACSIVRELDLFILGGGGILYDRDIELYLREVSVAREMGVPVMVYAVSAGPLESNRARERVREELDQARLVTVRDRETKKLLENIGVSARMEVTADPVLLLEPETPDQDMLAREGLEMGRRYVGISVREPGPAAPDIDRSQYHQLLADAADFLVDRYSTDVVFVPMERGVHDLQESHAVISRMLRPGNARVLAGEYSPGQLMRVMERFVLALGMRLHFLILASLVGVPIVGLPYASKVSGFLQDLGLAPPPLHLVNAGRLIAYIDRTFDSRQEQLDALRARLPELKARARTSAGLAVDILRQGRAGALPPECRV